MLDVSRRTMVPAQAWIASISNTMVAVSKQAQKPRKQTKCNTGQLAHVKGVQTNNSRLFSHDTKKCYSLYY